MIFLPVCVRGVEALERTPMSKFKSISTSAVPEMLEALIYIYKEFNALNEGMTDDDKKSCVECTAPNECGCINNAAIYAIEKATGMKIEEVLKGE